MIITPATTDEQLNEGVIAANKRIVEYLTNTSIGGTFYDELAGLVNSVAREEGRRFVRHQLREAVAGDATEQQIKDHLFRLVTAHPDDEWSGRRNDARRSYREGVRDEAKRMYDKVMYG